MKTDRELLQQALDALKLIDEAMPFPVAKLTIKNLCDRLAHCDRCGKKLGGEGDIHTCTPKPDAYGYASRLAVAIWEQHYKDVAPQWKPLDDLMGVLTQIDNMTTGLTRLAQPEQEPVAWLNKEKNTIIWDKLYPDMQPLYTTPPQRKPLTLVRIEEIFQEASGADDEIVERFARGIEAAHGIKENT